MKKRKYDHILYDKCDLCGNYKENLKLVFFANTRSIKERWNICNDCMLLASGTKGMVFINPSKYGVIKNISLTITI